MTSDTENLEAYEHLLARIMDEILEAPKDARRSSIDKHIARYPMLRSQIEQQIEMVQALESAAPRLKASSSGQSIGAHLDGLPALMQKVIVMRSFKKLRWNEISTKLGLPEGNLQQIHAKAMRELVERFGREARELHDK